MCPKLNNKGETIKNEILKGKSISGYDVCISQTRYQKWANKKAGNIIQGLFIIQYSCHPS
jgi:hypothetical protein